MAQLPYVELPQAASPVPYLWLWCASYDAMRSPVELVHTLRVAVSSEDRVRERNEGPRRMPPGDGNAACSRSNADKPWCILKPCPC